MKDILILPDPEIVEKPNGRFFDSSFYWIGSVSDSSVEEEWGQKWLDGMPIDRAVLMPHYNKTGVTREKEND